jgi:polar amino acid transport system permease protein
MNSAAYQAEIIRGGVQTLHPGQIEAARSLGFTHWTCVHRIIMPQVIYKTLPPLTNEVSSMIKGSSLISIISVVELTRAGQQIVSVTFRPLEIYVAVGGIYLVIYLLCSLISRKLEQFGARYR